MKFQGREKSQYKRDDALYHHSVRMDSIKTTHAHSKGIHVPTQEQIARAALESEREWDKAFAEKQPDVESIFMKNLKDLLPMYTGDDRMSFLDAMDHVIRTDEFPHSLLYGELKTLGEQAVDLQINTKLIALREFIHHTGQKHRLTAVVALVRSDLLTSPSTIV